MRTRSIEILPDHFYHIYNRGNNKQPIFREEENFRFFLRQYQKYFSAALVQLVAYCLMPNHYHLLVLILQQFDFSNHMRSFSTSFAKSIHSWYHTSGHLFEDDYQAKPIADDSHLIQVIPYIHLNPVLAGLVRKPQKWEYSDCSIWSHDRGPFLGENLRRHLYGSAKGYREYLDDSEARKKEIREIEGMLLLKKSARSKKSDI